MTNNRNSDAQPKFMREGILPLGYFRDSIKHSQDEHEREVRTSTYSESSGALSFLVESWDERLHFFIEPREIMSLVYSYLIIMGLGVHLGWDGMYEDVANGLPLGIRFSQFFEAAS